LGCGFGWGYPWGIGFGWGYGGWGYGGWEDMAVIADMAATVVITTIVMTVLRRCFPGARTVRNESSFGASRV